MAIASASKKGGRKGAGFLNKKRGARKPPAPPSRFDKVKQVFGQDERIRERNLYCMKNVSIFIGKLSFNLWFLRPLHFTPMCCNASPPAFFLCVYFAGACLFISQYGEYMAV